MVQANFVSLIFFTAYGLQCLFELWIERLNIIHTMRRGRRIPPYFEDVVDEEKLSRMSDYALAQSRLGLAREVLSEFLMLIIILSGLLVGLNDLIVRWQQSQLVAPLLFYLAPSAVLFAADLPFDYYHTFVIEERFGFNRSTVKIWLLDKLKSGVLSVILLFPLLTLIVWMTRVSPQHWWLWGGVAVSSIQVVLAVLYPVLIAPLFNKFEPIRDELLAAKIKGLMEENGIRVKTILQMNAGLRSRHTNAYFTGLGKTKQIVLFDTLLESHSHDEILAVLAHEVGHFKKKHIVKQLLLFEASIFACFFLTHLLLKWPVVYSTFGFSAPEPYVGLFIIGIFWQKIGFFVQPLLMATSRRFEREADLYAAGMLRTTGPMVTTLKKMASDNLSNLTPHPLYVWFHYSHPPLVERIATLENAFDHTDC